MKRGKRVGAFDATQLIVPLILLGGGYLLYKNFFGDGGPTGSGQNNSAIDQGQAAAAASSAAAAAAAGSKQTLTDSTLSTLANTLYYQLTNEGDQTQIVNDIYQLNTWADWAKLVQFFGTKKVNLNDTIFSLCGILSINCQSVDLATLMKHVLDANRKSDINDYFNEVGIPMQL